MAHATSQHCYPLFERPVVLGLLHGSGRHRAELLPSMMDPGPRLKEAYSPHDQVQSYELAVPSSISRVHQEMCELIQYTVYWIAENTRLLENESESLDLQYSFFGQVKGFWNEWVSGRINTEEFMSILSDILLELSNEAEQAHIMMQYRQWKKTRVSLSAAERGEEGCQFSRPNPDEKCEAQYILSYSIQAIAILSKVTEKDRERMERNGNFESKAKSIQRSYFKGFIKKSRYMQVMNLLFQTSCIAASSISSISYETKREIDILEVEAKLDKCRSMNIYSLLSEKGECSICLGDFEGGQEVSTTPCKHMFHTQCLREALFDNPDCAMCRASIR